MQSIKIRDEMHWRQLRAENIGSSDISALFDQSPYLTRFELYHQKKNNQIINFDSDRMFWGRSMEPAIAKGVERAKGWKLIKSDEYFLSENVKGMGCTPDFIIQPIPEYDGPGIAEIKNVDGLQYKKEWLNDEPPIYYILQLQQQLACTGFKWGIIAVLIGGNDLKIFFYQRHEAAIKKIESAVTQFWDDVAKEIEPKVVGDDYDIIKDLYPIVHSEIDLSTDNHLPELCAKMLVASATRLKAEKEEKDYKAQIIHKLQGHDVGRANGFFIKFPEIIKNMSAKEAHVQKYRQLTVKQIEE